MRNILALAAAAAIAFIVLGYFLGWYEVKKTPTGSGTKYEVNVNNPKITQDLNKGKEKLRTWINSTEPGSTAPPSQQTVRPSSETLPDGIPAAFKITDDGTLVFPGSPPPQPSPTPPH